MKKQTLIIDGYNVIFTGGLLKNQTSPQALNSARSALIQRAVNAGLQDTTTTIVFDAKQAPPGQPAQLEYRGVRVMFAVDQLEADDLIEDLIRQHAHPATLTVVSSDRRLQVAAQRRGAAYLDSDSWLSQTDDQLSRRWKPPNEVMPLADSPESSESLSADQLGQWLAYFNYDEAEIQTESAVESTDAQELPKLKEDDESPLEEAPFFSESQLAEFQKELDAETQRRRKK
jgi:predicted RNA-binding protein with PIN domain